MKYDTVIIGAGIAGASIAYRLTEYNQRVLVLDSKGIASGGSGAAGAFVSPKIGKGSALQTLTNEAFLFAKDFYLSTCPEYFHQTGVLRIPKDENDAQMFLEYEKFNDTAYEKYSLKKLEALGIKTMFESFYFPEAGNCDALLVCAYLLKETEILIEDALMIERKDNVWKIKTENSTCLANNIVLATGYKSSLIDMRYMGIRGTWGTRGDFRSTLELPISMHQSISVGANVNGMIKLGATHEKGIKNTIPCCKEQALGLQSKADLLIDASDLELQGLFCGMRAGSKDYFPLVGKVVDVPSMLESYPSIVRGAKPPIAYVENLYVINGLGGRGFVFAPLMAKILAEHIVEDKEIDRRVNPDRLFLKWCRKSPDLKR